MAESIAIRSSWTVTHMTYRGAFAVFLLVVPAVFPASAFSRTATDIDSCITANRWLLEDIGIQITRTRQDAKGALLTKSEQSLVRRGKRYRYQKDISQDDTGNDRNKRIDCISASDGRVDTTYEARSNLATVSPSKDRNRPRYVSDPWYLLGATGSGIGDPLDWLKRSTVDPQYVNGREYLKLTIDTDGKGVRTVPDCSYAIFDFDEVCGGVVLHAIGYNSSNEMLFELINSDISQTSSGFWYPKVTELLLFRDGRVAKTLVQEVKETIPTDSEEKGFFRPKLPEGVRVRDEVVGGWRQSGASSLFLDKENLKKIDLDLSLPALPMEERSQHPVPTRISSSFTSPLANKGTVASDRNPVEPAGRTRGSRSAAFAAVGVGVVTVIVSLFWWFRRRR